MKKYIATSAILTSALLLQAAEISSYDSALIGENADTMSKVSEAVNFNTGNWNKSALNFNEVFGVDFDATTHELKVVTLATNFGIQGQSLGIINSIGAEGAMHTVYDSYAGYTGQESYISYADGESFNFQAYSQGVDRTYDLFGASNEVFSWTTAEIDTWFYDASGALVNDKVTTLLVGFEDSHGVWDWDYNDVIFAIQVVPVNQAGLSTSTPSGQPLPGVLATLALGAAGLGWLKRRKK